MKHLKNSNITTNGFELSRIGQGYIRMDANTGKSEQEVEAENVKTIHAALDAGVNYLNTADLYYHGQSEMLIREALKSRKREDVFISVKFGTLVAPGEMYYGIDVRPQAVKSYLAYTLKRLGTDYVDLYQPCRIDPNIPIEDTIGAVADLVKAGYVRNVGISDADGDALRRANAEHPISLVEVQYSLLNRGIEEDLLPAACELGIRVVAFGTLFNGLIGGSAQQDKLTNLSKRMSSAAANDLSKRVAQMDALKKIADEKSITMAQLAIAWVLNQGDDIIALVGSRTPSQVSSTVAALDIHFTAEDLERIERIIPKEEATSSYMLSAKIDKNGLFQR